MTAFVLALLLLPTRVQGRAAFVSRSTSLRQYSVVTRPSARDDFYHEPHFEVMQSASSSSVLDAPPQDSRMLECAQQGECSVEEMDRMIAGASCLRRETQQRQSCNNTHILYSCFRFGIALQGKKGCIETCSRASTRTCFTER